MPEIPSQAEIVTAWESRLQKGKVYAKTAKVNAKCMVVSGTLETVIDGKKETEKAYRAGDYIVQNPGGERYCVDHDGFHKRYSHAFEPAETKQLQAEGFRQYTAIGRIWAHQVTEEEVHLCRAAAAGHHFLFFHCLGDVGEGARRCSLFAGG